MVLFSEQLAIPIEIIGADLQLEGSPKTSRSA